MTQVLQVTLIVTVYNAAAWIQRVLASLRLQTYPAGLLEFIVVDDGSRDNTATLVEEMARQDKHIRLIRQVNQGTAGAVTTGLTAASGDVIALLSHDCYAAPDWIARVVQVLEADPQVGIVQGPILPTRPIDMPFYHCITLTRPSRSFEGAAIAYRATAVDKAGRYFDRDLSRYGDDTDMAWRILEQGYTSAWLDAPTAYHEVIPKPFWLDWRNAFGVAAFPRLVGRHPALRQRLYLGFLWGSPYRYPKMAGLHAAIIAGMLGQHTVAVYLLAFTMLLAWYENLRAYRNRPVAVWHKIMTLPLQQLVSEFIASYALAVGSLRWRSLVL